MHVYVYVCARVCTCVYVYMWRPEVQVWWLSGRISQWTWNSLIRLDWQISKLSGILLSLPPQRGDCRHTPPAFNTAVGIWSQMRGKHLFIWIMSLASAKTLLCCGPGKTASSDLWTGIFYRSHVYVHLLSLPECLSHVQCWAVIGPINDITLWYTFLWFL